MRLSTKDVIWMALKPILKLLINAAGGFALARAGIITPATAKTVSKIIVNLLLPSLLISKLVLHLDIDEIANMGISILVLVTYILLGLVGGLLMKSFLPLPEGFKGGFVSMNVWGNFADLPLAVLMSIGNSPPFLPGESAKGSAYTAMFYVVFNFTLFVCGGSTIIESDFSNPVVLPESIPLPEVPKRDQPSLKEIDDEPSTSESASDSMQNPIGHHSNDSNITVVDTLKDASKPVSSPKWKKAMKRFLRNLMIPPNIATFIGVTVALVAPLKGLFIARKGSSHEPCLSWVLDSIITISGAYIPLAFVNLGAALSKISVHRVPKVAALAITFFKMIVFPFIGVGYIQLLTYHTPLIDPEDRVFRFLLMFGSCVPSATTLLLLTQFYNPTGKAKEITGILALQYLVGFVTMVISMVIILNLLF
ncbi:auxin efflux carrier [Basidiobolus meristosporus CBS 931.73]|uniref:Auxin efflux carrier n=1 Tax=Basidiobolus meristosporus CBS 931.73 TaxID=1314790 RepID=A0A1Y1YDY8_9FUNG|nr:auxin efflux carrier [Basidiobolus meristosporus CBS 931.73]|eukprot:ORX95824.1 auxin efflux carrier [Basidiobolus meristosporus CBS 931.73]